MGLKQLIKKKKILSNRALNAELVLPGEPLIYSIKYAVGRRTRSLCYFRNGQWKSLLRTFFPAYFKTKVPVVILVLFYVSPPSHVDIKASDLKSEKIPAVFSFELCDYFLSFIEMFHHTLLNSYKQIVKIDMVKFYSNNPRTVFKYVKWDHYLELQNYNSVHAAT